MLIPFPRPRPCSASARRRLEVPGLRVLLAAACLVSAPVALGCATSRTPYAATESALALDRVVLYRNGVGYFQRTGSVDGDLLRLKVRRDQLDDLLKSLTVIDRGSGRALSISMPLDPQTWASAAHALLGPGRGGLADVLDGLRGTEVVLHTDEGRIRGRIVLVEQLFERPVVSTTREAPEEEPWEQRDHRVTLLDGAELHTVKLSAIRSMTLVEGDLALQLHRRLDGSAGEGMFQQVDLEVRLAGGDKHKLDVSYVVAAPMWKPTYRVVLPESGKGEALLQAWAVVDNTSGEDWTNVTMSLTSGEPIAFQYDLHTPRDVLRPDLSESGVRRRAQVAVGETTFDEPAAAEADDYASGPMFDQVEAEAAMEREEAAMGRGEAKKASRRMSAGGMPPAAAAPPPPPPEPEPAVSLDALRRSTLASARAETVSGMSRYDLGDRVTIPNGSSTMVAIVNASVEAEETFLFRPGGAGIGYDANPYRVVRFKNSTPFVLEPGPISIYSGGSFVGEGLSETVGSRTSATIPFAVEPTILVSSSVMRSGDDMRLIRIVRGVLEVETFSRVQTTWTVRGRTEQKPYTVLVRHSKEGPNYALVERPEGTEDLVDAYLLRVNVPANTAEGSLVVVEQTPGHTSISIWDGSAPALLENLLVAGDLTPKIRAELEPIVTRRLEIGRIDTEIEGLRMQRMELDQRAEETRRNLEAIKKDNAAGALRSKLNARLDDFTKQADALGRRVVELQSQRLEKKIDLEDRLQNLDLDPAAGAPAK